MNPKFRSKDFYLSAFLISIGFSLIDFYREKGFTTFTFENTEKLQNSIKKFYSLKAHVEPVKYSQAIRSLKGSIHSLAVSTSNQDKNNELIQISKGTK
jgi:NAD-dependent SIR2 family protein deacetylase